MATAKQKAWRAKFVALYGHGHRHRKAAGSGKTMAKHYRHYGGRRSGSGGLMNMALSVAAGFVAGKVSPSLPAQAQVLGAWTPTAAGALAGYMVGKKKGALLGAAGGYFANGGGSSGAGSQIFL